MEEVDGLLLKYNKYFIFFHLVRSLSIVVLGYINLRDTWRAKRSQYGWALAHRVI